MQGEGEGEGGSGAGVGAGLRRPHRCAPAAESSLALCLRLERCQECSRPLRKRQSTFLG